MRMNLYQQIKDDLAAIGRSVLGDESDYIERQWEEIASQIRHLAASARVDIADRASGYRIIPEDTRGPESWECLECVGAGPSPAGSKACANCGSKFNKRPRVR